MTIVICGGHHSSALPVIRELKSREPATKIVWFGHKFSQRGNKNPTLEYLEITSLGIPFYNLQAGKFYKTFDPIRLVKIPFGFFHALFLLLRVKPDVILSFGGYLAVPTVLAGFLLGVPSITHEQTLVTGWANALISRFAKKILISWKESAINFPRSKVVFTGLPLRPEIFKVSSSEFESNNDMDTIYITGGKTGAHIINEVVYATLEELLKFVNVIHQCGDHSLYNDYDILLNLYNKLKSSVPGKYYPRRFVMGNEIGEAFAVSSLVVSRAGAHSVGELLALKKPCILIPIPWVSHNEQFKNAKVLQDTGLAHILEEKNLTPQAFIEAVKNMISFIRTKSFESGIKVVNFERNAEVKIADEVFKICARKKEKTKNKA